MGEPELYQKLAATATGFINATQPDPAGSNQQDSAKILSFLTKECRLDFGHEHFVAQGPAGLRGQKTGQEFVDHMKGMADRFETWRIEVGETIVDVRKRRVVIRAAYWMKAVGQEAVLNDIVFLMTVDESGDKLVACTEFIDPTANAELVRRVQAGAVQ